MSTDSSARTNDPHHPPRWAWWAAGIAVPLLGIFVTLLVDGGDGESPPPPAAAPPAQSSPAESPDGDTDNPPLDTESPSASEPSDTVSAPSGYTLREGRWGISPGECTDREQQMVDLDSGVSTSVTTTYSGRGEMVEGHEGAELVYFPASCTGRTNYKLRALRGVTAGLLPADAPKTFDDCKAFSGSGLGPVPLYLEDDREDHGFVEGAAVCAITDQGHVAMAVVESIRPDSGDATVTGPLYVWTKDS
jgi:hypothetical protein